MGVLLVSYVHLGYVTHYLGREQTVIYCYNDLKVVWALSCSKKKIFIYFTGVLNNDWRQY